MSEDVHKIQIHQSSTLFRGFADELIPIFNGKDVEICFIQIAAKIDLIEQSNDSSRIKIDGVEGFEIARIRANPADVIQFCFTMLKTASDKKMLKQKEALQKLTEIFSNTEA
jgi:hypothetical protein